MAISQKAWTLGGIGAGVLMVGLTYVVGVGPALSHNSSVKSQTAAAADSNTLLAIKNSGLRAESKKLDSLTSQLAGARVELPISDDLAGFTRRISAMAAADNVSVTSLSVSAPVVTSSTGSVEPATAVSSAAGKLFEIPVNLIVTGKKPDATKLLVDLQASNSRAILINTVSIASSAATTSATTGSTVRTAAAQNVTVTIAMKIFVAPQTPAAAAAIQKELKAAAGK